MVRKIKYDEYLKEYGALSEDERKDYWRRVGEWLQGDGKKLLEQTDRPMAKAQNIVQLSMRWKETEVRMFTDGVRLLSALVNVADTWLPSQLYVKAAYRAVRQMVMILQTRPQHGQGGDAIASQRTKPLPFASQRTKPLPFASQRTKKTTATPAGEPPGAVGADATAQAPLASRLSPRISGTGVPVRPRHIDQYAHLLPEKTQERAAKYGPLMREMGEARENLRLLMDAPGASSASLESWAKSVTKIDGEVKAIREELDREWAKLVEQGRVVVDDLGNARVSPTPSLPEGEGTPAWKTDGHTDGDADNQRKAALLRKWLIDMRYGNGDKREEYQQKWREKYRKMVLLGGPETVTEKVRAAARHYGIDLDTLNANGHDVL